ncbi:NTP/NDP exchange transporter [Paraliomyxa miuraensis]|uniref:NTP/NDP exchange transporter n=1 Tax=Paraliomyxa miuraensis TaxID=376150 RepID=UPI00225BFA71|nr:MFS transporter [Paraliomyxa miuraensis]MCX4242022.1 MFS transporter [Paraliomyxa miuraensis]
MFGPEEARERRRTLEAAACFFALMAGYYVLRPVRDEMGIEGGVEQLHWLYTGTFLAVLVVTPLLSWLIARLRRRAGVPVVYGLMVLQLLGFAALLPQLEEEAKVVLARVIYVWVSVFNMFMVSLFWALMADRFSIAASKRRFGLVSAGGSAGALLGPSLTAILASRLGTASLLLLAAGLLALATGMSARLGRRDADESARADERPATAPLGGASWRGFLLVLRSPQLLGISGYIVLYSAASTFLYFEQANVVEAAISDAGERTQLFARMDLYGNGLALCLQALATAGLVRRFGVGWLLLSVPVLTAVGFGALALAPTLAVIVTVQVLRRALNFALAKPAREILFTGVSPAERYEGKLVIDTVVYRGGDAISAWAFAALLGLGLSLPGIAVVGIPVALVGGAVARFLGRRAVAAQ